MLLRRRINALTFTALAAGLMLIFALSVGCENETDDGTGGGTATAGARQFITVGTAPDGGAFALVGAAIADVVDQNKGDLNWVVTTEGTRGTQQNIRKLESGDMEFAMSNAGIAYFAVNGEGDWKTPHEIRSVATLAPNVGIFVTTEGSGIKTIADLKGKRVVLGPAGAGFEYFLKPLLAAHGVSYDDLTPIPGDYFEAAEMIGDGKADAAFMGGAIPIPAVNQMSSTQKVVFVQLDDDIVNKLKDYSFYFPVPIKDPDYAAIKEGLNVGSMQLITHANVDEDLVYEFTKRMYENRAKIAEKHPAGKAINETNVIRDTGVPFHPGAIRYYKEIGIWKE